MTKQSGRSDRIIRPKKADWEQWVGSHFASIQFFNSAPSFPEGEGRPYEDQWLVSKIEPFGVYFRCERLIVDSAYEAMCGRTDLDWSDDYESMEGDC